MEEMNKSMKFLFILFVLLFAFLGHAQGESEGPLLTNPSLYKGQAEITIKNHNPLDSSFYFLSDTLTLPFFDDFSTNKFQDYEAQIGDPNVAEEKHYAIWSNGTPVDPASIFTSIRTVRRTVDVSNGTTTEEFLDSVLLDYSDLHEYPIVREQKYYFPPYNIIDTIDNPNQIDTVVVFDQVISQDSLTIFVVSINAAEKLWLDQRAFHNYHLAKDPWTLGVASFDGLDENGYPYSFGTNGSHTADVLTSKPIDLSVNAPSDSIYLSFLAQPEGFGDEPEDGDSLICELYDPVNKEWVWAWSLNGSPTTDFQVGHVSITNPNYFSKEFQFRFKNHGSIAGSLDHFHLDYVILRQNSFVGDTLFKDFALVYPPQSLLKDFQRVPWDHYKNSTDNKMTDQGEIVVRNGSANAENLQDGKVEVKHGGAVEGSYTLVGQTLAGGNINYAPRTTYYSYHDFSQAYQFDKSKPGVKQIFDIETGIGAPFFNEPVNDSAFTTQEFYNYYAYDDGTAERAYGPTGNQARLAIQFSPYETGSVIGAYMHFVPTVNDVSSSLFVITIWDDNNGEPGNVIYEDDLFNPRSPFYEIEANKFYPYYFEDYQKVPVGNTFYIGWRQFDAPRLNIGLDKNIDNSDHTFFSIDDEATWINSSISGSVMIRPIFSTGMDAELGISPQEPELSIVYPNPTTSKVQIIPGSTNQVTWELYELNGRRVDNGQSKELDLSDRPNGIYLLKIKGEPKVHRIVKQ